MFYLKYPSIPIPWGHTETLPLGHSNANPPPPPPKKTQLNLGFFVFFFLPQLFNTLYFKSQPMLVHHHLTYMQKSFYCLSVILANQLLITFDKSICLLRKFKNCFSCFILDFKKLGYLFNHTTS